ncbi:hypothetical protein BRADI_2g58691v3 [Brachypodium distachyon]|uniref:Reverse transcriptase zinc-binding domain-containing protein n=1 Tax=Brachypodium distachyon TaxID=15368 RepID=A0A2K2DGQ0_BRADI|nr:hypothetical protein BRADI_2g58691v3 [Brachypodium distachyon]
MATLATCNICGWEEEDEHHAVLGCTKARALREELRKTWDLPPECKLGRGHEWFQILLHRSSKDMRARLMMLFWHAWHLRNNIVFGDGKSSGG